MYALAIIVIASSLLHPRPHEALKVTLLYDSQYTCQSAERAVDFPTVKAVAWHVLRKSPKLHIHRVNTTCDLVNAYI